MTCRPIECPRATPTRTYVMTTAASLIHAVKNAAVQKGTSSQALFAKIALDPAVLEDRDARVPTPIYLDSLQAGRELTQDPCFGLTVARAMDGAAFGALGFVMASCSTLRDALQRFARYTRLLCDELRFDVIEQGDSASVVYALEGLPHVPELFEMAICHFVSTARKGTGDAFFPQAVMFRHRAPQRSLSNVLFAPVTFGAAQDVVICHRATLDLPLRGRNATLLGILERHVEHILAQMPNDEDLTAMASLAIRGLLPMGEPSLADVARRCGMGERTLQRKLRARGVTFRKLIDNVRRDAALVHLADDHVSVSEVAFALGFSDPSAFHHAFRRWTGRCPRDRT